MRYIQCPEGLDTLDSWFYPVFLAGGITGCPEWQPILADLLSLEPDRLVLLNPRRKGWDVNNSHLSEDQVQWEYDHLKLVKLTSFWFPCEALCPITLFELGSKSAKRDPIVVGCHPDYQRRFDVITQLQLARPSIDVVSSLEELAVQIRQNFYAYVTYYA